jgi:hypothetical protein
LSSALFKYAVTISAERFLRYEKDTLQISQNNPCTEIMARNQIEVISSLKNPMKFNGGCQKYRREHA